MKDWLVMAILALAAALALHALFPRYEWRTEGAGTSLVVYDRWQGRFQRVTFQGDGTLTASDVFRPF